MTITERSVADAVSVALSWQADSRNRVSEPPPSAEDTYKEAARSLGSPGAAVAVATLATTGWAPTPLGDDQAPSAAPLSTYQAVYEHFRGRHHDGAGLESGRASRRDRAGRPAVHRRRLAAVAEGRRGGGAPPGQ